MNINRRPVLQTERLTLKAVCLSDLDQLIQLSTDPEVMRYVGHGQIETKEGILKSIHLRQDYYQKNGLDFFSVFLSNNGEFIGQAGLFHLDFNPLNHDIWLAYRLLPQCWHQGYATELAKGLIKWGLEDRSLNQILAFVHPKNKRSQEVLKKAGMSYCGLKDYEGVARPYYQIKNTCSPNYTDIPTAEGVCKK